MVYRRGGTWWVRLTDHRKVKRSMRAGSSREVAERLLRNLIEMRDAASVGQQPDDRLVHWALRQLDDRRRDQVIAWGLIEPSRVTSTRPLDQQALEWGQFLRHRASASYADLCTQRLQRLLSQMQVDRFGDLTGDRVAAALRNLSGAVRRGSGTFETELSASTRNHYLRVVRMFANWMLNQGRAGQWPAGLRGLKPRGVKPSELKVRRRRLTDGEIAALMACEVPDHRLAYAIALNTGLRFDEIRRLVWRDIEPEALKTFGKNQRTESVPINAALRELLTASRGDRGDEEPVCRLPWSLAREIRRLTGAGDVDFHCLRHTFGTRLAEAGVHPAVHQKLMRHSTPVLSLGYYTHLSLADHVQAVEALSEPSPRVSRLKASQGR